MLMYYLGTLLLLTSWALNVTSSGINTSLELTRDNKIWSICDTNGTCVCGNDISQSVHCKDQEKSIEIGLCYCMYYDEDNNETILGNCIYTCFYRHITYSIQRYSVENASLFNNDVCSKYHEVKHTNREGRFCGRCKEGYGLAAYSYRYTTCIPCTDYGYKNWIKYFTVALLPLTLFYILMVTLGINVTSSRLNGIVFIVQCSMSSMQLKIFHGWMEARQNTQDGTSYMNLVSSIFGVVNLDFFRDVYPDFCLHPQMNFLHVVSLDYIVALYPFLLIFITYVLITMYDDNYRLLVWAWKPFKYLLKSYQNHFSTKTSLVETFATFILLSNVKILGVCCDILFSTRAYGVTRKPIVQRYLFFDANIEYFSREHLPFAILALSIGFVFVILPFLLLVLYPCRCFQRCLNHFGWRCQVLHVFMDAFQGSYKTEPYDLRYFSAFYLFMRFVIIIFTEITQSQMYILAIVFAMMIGTPVFSIFQPYKISSHNTLDIVSMFLLTMFYVMYTAAVFVTYIDFYWEFMIKLLFVGSIALMLTYSIGVILWMAFGNNITKLVSRIFRHNKHGYLDMDNPALLGEANESRGKLGELIDNYC